MPFVNAILVLGKAVGPPIDDPLVHFSLWGFVVFAALYTMLVFRGDLARKGPLIFAKENARTPLAILGIHAAFNALLFWASRAMPHVLPSLPRWMTDIIFTSRTPESIIADALLIPAVVAMHQIERRWLYVDASNAA
jgi:hypothetical protein